MYRKIMIITLVYGNYSDLSRFVKSIPFRCEDFKLVIVDSFKDNNTKNIGLNFSKSVDADFISVDNNGYGSGNNAGIKYALDNYEFDYLIITNPDVEIEKIDLYDVKDDVVMGPQVINLNEKNQNPHYYKKERLGFLVMRHYVVSENAFWLYLYLVINKISKFFWKTYFTIFDKKIKLNVYALHGSFFSMTKRTAKKLVPLFNEEMFLYAEENHLAELSKRKAVTMIYNSNWIVKHFEDGSGASDSQFTRENTLKSLRVFFKTWK
ncbi:hypothetical protein KGF64_14690 [Lactiplantibacillus plantarum]|uniref:hypothetical protein n=1 Tax=Lactiplantibacillus plantarum TaxID=1590 RepID=UPI001C20074A|nr:hypothetical protein [Lactiplantibacillus plantarum]MBU7468964.1 hypothetical protein [Lactiplantibacillus plantarum]MDT7023342.1 hypothetical protein [Lactiplantibacillus plantarum]